MKYVQRRASRFEFRYALPDDLAGMPVPRGQPEALAPLINARGERFKTELIRSLQTSDARVAERRALAEIARAHDLVDRARTFLRDGPNRAITAERMDALTHEHMRTLLEGDEALRQRGIGLDVENLRLDDPTNAGMSDDDLRAYQFLINFLDRELRDEVSRMRPGALTRALVEKSLAAKGIVLPADDVTRTDLERRFMSARRRAFDVIKARLQGEVIQTPAAVPEGNVLTLSEALKRWAEGGGQGAWKPRERSAAEATHAVTRFIELHGDLSISAVTKAHARTFRDAMAKVPVVLPYRLRKLTLPKLLEQSVGTSAPRRAQTTNKTLSLLGGVMARAERDGFFDEIPGWSNPFHVGFEIAAVDKEPYEPFSTEELKSLFASPVFAANARPKGGAGEAAFWLPLIALYSGARRTEIAQLRVGDLRCSPGGIWFFDLSGEGEDQSLKNASSARSVPVHPELIRIGLIEYHVRQAARGHSSALWPGFEPPITPKTKAWSKWFGRYLGQYVVESRAKTFHSFRHTFKRACREAGIAEEIHHALTGHAGGGVGRSYGRERREDGSLDRGVSLERLDAELAKVTYLDVSGQLKAVASL